MSSPATAQFLSAWRNTRLAPLTCITIALTDPTALTIRASTESWLDSSSVQWDPLVASCDVVRAPGDLMSSGTDLCSFSFSLVAKRAASNSGGNTMERLASLYRMQGATVTAYLTDKTTNNTLRVFAGIITKISGNQQTLDFDCIQSTFFATTMPPRVINTEFDLRAPVQANGAPVPVIYGVNATPAPRAPWPASTSRREVALFGGPKNLVGCTMMDTGRGGSLEKARIATGGMKIGYQNDPAGGFGLWMDTPNGPAIVEPQTALYAGASESGFYLADAEAYATIAVRPVTLLSVPNTVVDARALFDPFDESRFVHIGAGGGAYAATLPTLIDQGTITDIKLCIGYQTSANGIGWRPDVYGPHGQVTPANVAANQLAIASVPTLYVESFGGYLHNLRQYAWDFSSLYIRIFTSPFSQNFGSATTHPTITPTGWIRVFFMGLLVTYIPAQQASVTAVPTRPLPPFKPDPKTQPWPRARDFAQVELVATFAANVVGAADDGSRTPPASTWTGNPTAGLQTAGDIIGDLLVSYGGISLSNIPRAGTGHGDFILADNHLSTEFNQSEMHSASTFELTDVNTMVTDVAEGAGLWLYCSRFDSVWKLIPWKPSPESDYNYPVTLTADYVLKGSAIADRSPSSRAVTSIRIRYGYDALKRGFLFETSASAVQGTPGVITGRSAAGFEFYNLRDGAMKVVSATSGYLVKNNAWEITDPTSTKTFTIPAGDYTMDTLVPQLRTTCVAGGMNYAFGFGGRVLAGINDQFTILGNTYTIPPGTYTMDGFVTAINALTSNPPFSYDRVQRKFQFLRNIGAGSYSMSFPTSRSAAALFALPNTTINSSSLGSPTGYKITGYPIEENFFCVSASAQITLPWSTGAHGLLGSQDNPASVLGFIGRFDQIGIGTAEYPGTYAWTGDSPKNNMEAQVVASAKKYGLRRDRVIESRTIRETRTARALRKKYVDMLVEPRVVLTFKSRYLPDLERGRVLTFDSSMDAVLRFPSPGTDGSWVGKRLLVFSVDQHMGPDYYQEITAVEV